MKPLDKDLSIITHVLSYCEQIDETMDRFGRSQDIFMSDKIYRNAVALCILQIGELAGKLSDDFRHEHNKIPWQQIKATRNIVAHSYGSVDPVVTWEIITDDIPALKDYCQAIVNTEQQS